MGFVFAWGFPMPPLVGDDDDKGKGKRSKSAFLGTCRLPRSLRSLRPVFYVLLPLLLLVVVLSLYSI